MNLAIVALQVPEQSEFTPQDIAGLCVVLTILAMPMFCCIIDCIIKTRKHKAEKKEFESMSQGIPTAADAKLLSSMVTPDTNSATWKEVCFKINKAIQAGQKEVTVNLGAKKPEIPSEQFKAILCADPYNYKVESYVSNYAVIKWGDEE
jgi:hypothetical protein